MTIYKIADSTSCNYIRSSSAAQIFVAAITSYIHVGEYNFLYMPAAQVLSPPQKLI